MPTRGTAFKLPVRGKRAYIRGQRVSATGSLVPARLHPITGLAGAYSGKELEREAYRAAEMAGASPNDVVIETYAAGEAPVSSNPDHRHESTALSASGYAAAFGAEDTISRMRRRGVLST